MDNDWFTNEDEVDQEELEVALYSQIHFDPVIENVPATASNKQTPDLNFVQPSFQVKVRNFIRKQNEHSTVQKVVNNKKATVCTLDFISLSNVSDDKESSNDDDCDKDDTIPQVEELTLVPEHQPTEVVKCPQDAVKCDTNVHTFESDNEKLTPLEEKSVNVSDHSLIVVSDSDSEDQTNKLTKPAQGNTAASVLDPPDPPPVVVVCDDESDASGSDEEGKVLPTTIVLKYHQDSDGDDGSDNDTNIALEEPKQQDSESERDNSDKYVDPNSPATRKTKRTNLNAENNCEQDQETQNNEDNIEEESEEDEGLSETRYEEGVEMDIEPIASDEENVKRGADATLTTSCDGAERKWALDEKDKHVSKTPVNRYFNPNTIRCRNCNEEGHLALFCTKEKKIVCIFCGNQGHRHLDCPNAICFKCCMPGHKPSNCVDAKRNRYIECYRCWLKGHIGKACPDLWRQYHQTVGLDSKRIKEAKSKQNPKVYCYNCGHEGHLGFECDSNRMGLYVYPAYPFVAEYDKGRIDRDKHNRREKDYRDRHDNSYDRKERYRDMQHNDYHRSEEYDERLDGNYRHDRYKERQYDDVHRRDTQKGKVDKRSHRNEERKEKRDDGSRRKDKEKQNRNNSSSHVEEKQKRKRDDTSNRNASKDDGSDKNGKHKEKQEDSSNKKNRHRGKKDVGSHSKQEGKEKQSDTSKSNKKQCNVNQNASFHMEHNSKSQRGRGKKRKAEEAEAVDRRVSKQKRDDTTVSGLEDLRIQVKQNPSMPSTIPSGQSSTSKKKKKPKKKGKGGYPSEALEERYMPEPFVSGSSQFTYQEPTQSKYAENAKPSFNENSALNKYGYDRYDGFSGHDILEQSNFKGRRKQAFNEFDLLMEDGEIMDSSDGGMLSDGLFEEFESIKPSFRQRGKHKKRRHSPVSFIGLMD